VMPWRIGASCSPKSHAVGWLFRGRCPVDYMAGRTRMIRYGSVRSHHRPRGDISPIEWRT
jgi:hypothetical protein